MNVDHQHTKLPILGQHTLYYTSLLLKKVHKQKPRISEEDVVSIREIFKQTTRKSVRKQIVTIARSTVQDVLHKNLQELTQLNYFQC
jgi:uncharacterized protein YneF (UPF0154 family)